jgi:hypothetical protein
MASAVRLRGDYSADELRGLARRSTTVNRSRWLLSLAAVRDGMDCGAAAKIGGMDRQTLRVTGSIASTRPQPRGDAIEQSDDCVFRKVALA